MPIPRPRSGETRDAFISRCMGNDTMNREYPDNQQRAGVCYTQWRQKVKGNEKQLIFKTLGAITLEVNDDIQPRYETIRGVGYTIYPTVMMREGVHNGVLYTHGNIAEMFSAWNGVPIPLQHPRDEEGAPIICNSPEVMNSHPILGRVFNAHMEGDRLRAELWFETQLLNTIGAELKNRLDQGENVDVSTGLLCNEIPQAGEWNGEQYESIAINIRPDHLAVLPGVSGACSWADGCGIRANEKGGSSMVDTTQGKTFDKGAWDQFLAQTEWGQDAFKANEKEYKSLIRSLSQKVDEMDIPQESYNYLMAVYDSYVIYKKETRNGPSRMYRRNYSTNQEEMVEWTSDPVQVRKNVTYTDVPTTNNSKQQEEENMTDPKIKTMKECCPDKVKELITNSKGKFTADDEEALLAMTEPQFALIHNAMAPDQEETDTQTPAQPDPKANDETQQPAGESKAQTMEQLLANADPGLRESIQYGQGLLAAEKTKLIETITANEGNTFTKEQLQGFELTMLKNLAALAGKQTPQQPHPIYAGFGGAAPVVNQGESAEEVLPFPGYGEPASQEG